MYTNSEHSLKGTCRLEFPYSQLEDQKVAPLYSSAKFNPLLSHKDIVLLAPISFRQDKYNIMTHSAKCRNTIKAFLFGKLGSLKIRFLSFGITFFKGWLF